jgi:UDP-2,4-diacetamido-2,4,6-trideoxy-beta-L-altropyranose hydrolase
MKIGFRVDADSKIGIGHLKRCLSLASQIKKKKKKIKIFFLIKKTSNIFYSLIKKYSFHYFLLSKSIYNSSETISILKKNKINTLIIDHYKLDNRWEKKVKKNLKYLISIDDLNRTHFSDYLFKQNLDNKKIKITKFCKILSGKNFFILDDKYLNLKKKKINESNISFLINFGSYDIKNLTCQLLIFLLKKFPANKIKVVVEKNFRFLKKLNKIKIKNKNIEIYKNLKTLANITNKSDVCFGAGGIHNIERTSIGKLSFVINTAKNQMNNTKLLSKKKLIIYLGSSNNFNLKLIKSEIIKKSFLEWHRTKAVNFIDTHGTKRVANILANLK